MLSPHWPRALMSSLCWFSAPLLVQFSQRIAICCFYCPPDMLSLWSPGSKRGAVSYLTGDRYVVSTGPGSSLTRLPPRRYVVTAHWSRAPPLPDMFPLLWSTTLLSSAPLLVQLSQRRAICCLRWSRLLPSPICCLRWSTEWSRAPP